MFGLLKSKLKSFTQKLKEKAFTKEEIIEEETIIDKEPLEEQEEIKAIEEAEKGIELEDKEREAEQKIGEITKPRKEKKIEHAVETKEEKKIKEPETEKIEIEKLKKPSIEKRELKLKVGAVGKIKSVFKKYVELSDSDLTDLLFELELALLESDVNQDSAEAICSRIKKELVGKKVPKGKDFDVFINSEIKKILADVMHTEKVNLLQMISSKKEKPFVILFLGPNGAGKTTSIAKLTNYLQKNNLRVIWSASDTFRAASIEQLEIHARKLNVRVVKHKYGADPAAVAFDAIQAAKAKSIDVVLIDSAGRQETNKNLMEELKKIERVAKPDLNIFVGEALAGKTLLDQVKTYNQFLPIDGFILTKIDTDTKGGTSISLLYELKKPILYIGTGQHYDDFQEFSPEYILDRII